eukprot:2463406-Alexandrium_andersonii.AAC.1
MEGPQGERGIIANMSRIYGRNPCPIEAAESIQTDVHQERLRSNEYVFGLIGGDFDCRVRHGKVSPGWGLKY